MTSADRGPSSLIETFRRWRRKRRILAEFANLDAATRGEILSELALDEGGLSRLVAGSQNCDGLSHMLLRLRVDESVLAKVDPQFVASLRRNCAMCVDWRQCAQEIEAGTAAAPAPTYCPNRETLAALAPGSRSPAA